MLKWTNLPKRLTDPQTLPYVLLVLAFTIAVTGLVNRCPDRHAWRRPPAILFAITCMMFLPFVFIYDSFGTHQVNLLLINVQENAPSELARVGWGSFRDTIIDFGAALAVLVVGGVILATRVVHFDKVLMALTAIFLLESPLTAYAYRTVVPDPHYALIDLEVDFKHPVILESPDQKRNVVIIYLESVERTFRALEETHSAFRQLAHLEDNGVSFRNVGQVHGTEFTVGGMVATQCGIPLMPRGALSVRGDKTDRLLSEAFENEAFLQDITCLGDILERDGYTGSYMNGSSLSLFSKGPFHASHGYTRLTGVEAFPGNPEEAYENVWGMNDDTLFSLAERELSALAASDAPFILTLLTIATHPYDGFPDSDCTSTDKEESHLTAAIRCTSAHVLALLERLEQLGIANDTIVVLLSDHLMMRSTLSSALESSAEARRNLVTVLGAGSGEAIMKPGSTLDVYPTLLELLGYGLEDGRANLGVSLLSERPTLAGLHGEKALSRAFEGNHALADFLWSGASQIILSQP